MKQLIKKLYHHSRFLAIIINHVYNFYITSKLTNPYIRKYKLKRLNKELDIFIKKILAGENFALVRNGDGERAIMMGKKIIAQENWSSPNYISKLGCDLLASLNVENERFYYGISCPCCDKEAYFWYSSRISNKNITFANIWVNVNFRRFKGLFEQIKRDCVLIANHRARDAKIGNLNILKHYEIGDDCISFWEDEAQELLKRIKKDFGNRENLLFIVSAGPMSSPMIKELFLHNQNNCYVDFGSSIDSYYTTKQTRPYQDKHSMFGCRNCYIYDEINMDISVILTLFKRRECLNEQVDAVLNQSIKPKEIILFIDSINREDANIYEDFENLPKDLEIKFSNIIAPKYNVGVWGRFAGGLLAHGKYVCFFDDDTIPAHRYLENCYYENLRCEGLYGGTGIVSNNLSKYPFDSYYKVGWENKPPFCINNKSVKRVDFVGHSWFVDKDYLGAMWIGSSEFYAMRNVAEDAYISYALKKYCNIKTFVPPHKDSAFFSSTKGVEYGTQECAISQNMDNFIKMNNAIRLLKSKYKMQEVSFSLKFALIFFARNIVKRFIKDENTLRKIKNRVTKR